jgi:F-type H+-transporting ATPase subunit b
MPRSLASVLLFGALLAVPAFGQQAQPAPTPAQQARASAAKAEHMDAPATRSDIEQYRHSTAVQAIARTTGLSVETTAQIFEDFNSGVLILAIAYFLIKFIPGLLRRRSETIQKDLSQARAATEDANRRLAEVEARLSRLGSEIDAIRQQAERDSVEDEKRIAAALEAERQRIVASAEQEIAAAQAAAQRELRKFAADLAVDAAMHRIQLTADTDRALVQEFGKGLGDKSGGGTPGAPGRRGGGGQA